MFYYMKCCKVITMGCSGVGKTTIANKLCNRYSTHLKNQSTIGVSFMQFKDFDNGIPLQVQLWDTAGQEKFHSLVDLYIRNTDLVLLVFNLNKPETLTKLLNFWYKKVENYKFIVIGNFYDDKSSDYSDIENRLFELPHHIYIRTCAIDNYGIDEIKSEIIKMLVKIEHNVPDIVHNHDKLCDSPCC